MSSTTEHKHDTASWNLTGSWLNAWKVSATVGFLGLLGCGAGITMNARRFAFSWMFAYCVCLTIALGAMSFVLIQRLTSAHWSVTVRRTAEHFSYGIIALIPLFIPVLFSMGHLFPWLSPHSGQSDNAAASISLVTPAYAQDPRHETHGPAESGTGAAGKQDHAPDKSNRALPGGSTSIESTHDADTESGTAQHGDPRAHAQHEAHNLVHAEVMGKKAAYLNKNFFYLRAVLYFLIWTVLAARLFGFSATQDTTKDPNLTVRAQRFAPGATVLFALTLTFAAFDWVMSLQPDWFSTIFGVYFFATGVVSSYAVIILVTMALKNAGPLKGAVTVEHFHDLGKLMFGFNVFWAYIGFSQFMLIWYAALPEETTWYHFRWDYAPWPTVSMLILFGHFVFPFLWTISRNFKRNLGRLRISAAVILVMHVVDIYWFVMPNYLPGKEGFGFSFIDIACLCAVGGIYGAFVFYRMTKYSLVPVGDPRLERSLHFQNA
ncbi:MAG: hypothetical protein JWP97_1804 [Labilithrix sp.]|nr:hypothetical protein [Labilithrix sp.]